MVLATGLLAFASTTNATPIPGDNCGVALPIWTGDSANAWNNSERTSPDFVWMASPAISWNELPCVSSNGVKRTATAHGSATTHARAQRAMDTQPRTAGRGIAALVVIDDAAADDARQPTYSLQISNGAPGHALQAADANMPTARGNEMWMSLDGYGPGFGIGTSTTAAGMPLVYSLAAQPELSDGSAPGQDRGARVASIAATSSFLDARHQPRAGHNNVPWSSRPLPELSIAESGGTRHSTTTLLPEPGTLALFGVGILLLIGHQLVQRRRP